MVLAAMANPPEHDFAPSWLKIPSDQQKRGQKLGASDQWSGSNKSSQNQQDDGNKSRLRHYSSTDSSHPSSGGYGRSPSSSSSSSSSSGPPQGGYSYRGREPDRRNYPRPGSGSRHHSVDDLNGFHDYGGWNIPQYNGGFYSNYPRRGSSTGVRDGPNFGGSRYGDVFHQGGRGYYNNSSGSGGRGGGPGGRQRYPSGSRTGYNDRDSQPEGSSSSSHGGDDGHKDVTAKKEEGGKDSKTSALSSNDFPSLVGDNSKSNNKDAAKTTSTPAGVWEKPPGTGKVQISGRKVQLIKKSIHNDLPPRDPSTPSSIKSSSKTSSVSNSEGSKGAGQVGSGARGSRPLSSGSAPTSSSSSSSNSGMYKPSAPGSGSQKSSLAVKVNDSSATSSAISPPKPATKDTNTHSPRSTTITTPPKPTSYVPTKPPTISAQPHKPVEKKATPGDFVAVKSTTKDAVGKPESGFPLARKEESKGFPLVKKEESKAGPGNQTQANGNGAKSSGRESSNKAVPVAASSKPVLVAASNKPVLVATSNKPVLVAASNKPVLVAVSTTQKPATKQLGGKESPTKPILVQSPTTAKPTIKPMSVKNTNGKPALKESPIRPVPVQIKTTKFSGKESPIRPFPVRTPNPKQGNRDRSVRPGPVQIKSNRLLTKETPQIRPVPVNIMTRKPAAKDNPSNAVTLMTRSVLSSNSKEKHAPTTGTRVNTTSTLAKEPSTNPTSTLPMDIQNPRIGLNKNVNNSDCTKDGLKGLQNGGDNWAHKQNGPLRIEDADRTMNGPQHSTHRQIEDNTSTESNKHLTSNGLDNDHHTGRNNLELSSSLEAEKRLLQEMGWHEHSDNEEGYAPITEDEMKEFQRRSQQLKRNGIARSLPVAFMSSSLPSTPVTSIDLDDALSSCSSDSSDDDL